MTNTIARLWNGDIYPLEKSGADNHEIVHLKNLIYRNYEQLQSSLNERQKEILKKYEDCCAEYVMLVCEEAFCDGYCLGTRISSEALLSSQKKLQDFEIYLK